MKSSAKSKNINHTVRSLIKEINHIASPDKRSHWHPLEAEKAEGIQYPGIGIPKPGVRPRKASPNTSIALFIVNAYPSLPASDIS